jgi:peptidoglycan/LPS O-acetylase OafA/YrhL
MPAQRSTGAPSHHRRSPHDAALDGLRGIAVLMVFVFHYGGGMQSPHLPIRILGYLTETGWIGVVLFFALSGFLITGGLWDSLHPSPDHSPVRAPQVLRNFYARRALRILPLYFFVLLIAAVSTIAFGSQFSDLRPLAIYAFFLQDLPWLAQAAIHNVSPLPVYHLWSLAVEEQFYLLWPALLLLARTRRGALHVCLWSFALAAVFRFIVFGLTALAWTRQLHLFDSFLLTQCGALALGAALALALRSGSAAVGTVQRWAGPALFTGLALYLVSSVLCGSLLLTQPLQYILGLPGVSIASAALLVLLLRPGLPRTIASIAPLAWLGRISYGFYVLHILLRPIYTSLTVRIFYPTPGLQYEFARFAVGLALTTFAAWLSYHLLELPFLQAKGRFPFHPSLPSKDLQT